MFNVGINTKIGSVSQRRRYVCIASFVFGVWLVGITDFAFVYPSTLGTSWTTKVEVYPHMVAVIGTSRDIFFLVPCCISVFVLFVEKIGSVSPRG